MIKIKQALISVSDKQGLLELANYLDQMGVEIISTGGTAKTLKEAGIAVIPVAEVTNFPEMLDGRIKTLHPHIHAGILAERIPEHLQQLEEHKIKPIDLVVVNLYPFAKTITKPDVELEEIIENIDIGGPTMIRAAAKNYKYVGVVVSPARYEELLLELKKNDGCLSLELSYKLACEAFAHTAQYDSIIHQYLEKNPFPLHLNLSYEKVFPLRYGENPHQQAGFYKNTQITLPGIGNARQLHGKELSYNNILDLDSALALVGEFEEDFACAIIKHNNPCGVAVDEQQLTAYKLAYETDPTSAFGGIIGFNRQVEKSTAEEIIKTFIEAIVAPGFSQEALEILKTKKDLRLLEVSAWQNQGPLTTYHLPPALRTVGGSGLLVQDNDLKKIISQDLKIVTKRQPSPQEMKAMLFGWKVAKHVKSNAIVLAKENRTIGIGAGQTSRVDSVKIAINKTGSNAFGTIMASDAFFPFRDGIDLADKVGVRAVIQPGGSLRDEEVIKAADEYAMTMAFTGIRHFKH
ncbi:MAG: bifunctional phosphoribosylaminoimidazolecarboxamide formyltransferase/IMP cyclohydrolase [bacterium]|nr:bifunctional phosphoribosylaminoimidazolecarboxamide formyltransferase/IMP cyclohydrolase [bacterium]